MKIFLGADHGGFALKEQIKVWLEQLNYTVSDLGATQLDANDDYPQFSFAVAKAVAGDHTALGILFCRSGAGMTIAANKIKNIRAVEVFSVDSARSAKQHNNANVISLSADWLTFQQAQAMIQTFLNTPFNHEERHVRRIQQISDQENK